MYWKYLKQLLRHKWFVFLETRRRGMMWLGIVHDLSKFRLDEFIPYARFFYGNYPEPTYSSAGQALTYDAKQEFYQAWNRHQKRNKHHWQYWMLTNDSEEPQTICLPMPIKYMREMLADWYGAGRAYGNPDTPAWYKEHRYKIILHPSSRAWIEFMLGLSGFDKNFITIDGKWHKSVIRKGYEFYPLEEEE